MRMRDAFIACFLLIAVESGTQAQVYRCERDGKTAFSDQPCEAGAKASQKVYATSLGSGVIDSQIATNHYEVQGSDYVSLSRSLKANGPKGFHGLASWRITYEYTTERQQNACRIATVRLKVSGEILMPKWTDEAAAPLELQRRWNNYYSALKRHEDGHIQHGKELAQLVNERLLGLGDVSCSQLPSLAQGAFQRLYDNLKARDREYDVRTNHGETQGALFR
jgi:predicted secreted Zn-dependent protease